MIRSAVIVVFAFLLGGCELLTPSKGLELTVDSVLILSDEIDMAEKRGWIDNETEDDLQNKLIDALTVMKSAGATNALCGAEVSQQECAQLILLDVEARLREAENDGR